MDAPATNDPQPARRRDAVSWALSATTLTVLAVGLLVIRSTRSERPSKRPDSLDTAPTIVETPAQDDSQVIVLLPNKPHSGSATAERRGADGVDLR